MRPQVIGIICLVAGLGVMIWHSKEQAKYQEYLMEQEALKPKVVAEDVKAASVATATPTETNSLFESVEGDATKAAQSKSNERATITKAASERVSVTASVEVNDRVMRTAETANAAESLKTIENEYVRVTFSTHGGAIKHVEFINRNARGKLLYAQTVDSDIPYKFNEDAPLPALSISLHEEGKGPLAEYNPVYELVEGKTPYEVSFRRQTASGMVITRSYQLNAPTDEGAEPYLITHKTTFNNQTGKDQKRQLIFVNAGALPPTEGDMMSQYLNFPYYDADSEEVDFVDYSEFVDNPGFFFGVIGKSTALPYVEVLKDGRSEGEKKGFAWGGIKNQFFTGLITSNENAMGFYVSSHEVDLDNEKFKDSESKLLTGNMAFDLGIIKANEARTLELKYYVGPMELKRIKTLGSEADRMMQMGWKPIAAIAQILLTVMGWIHSMVVSFAPSQAWGITIILLTMLVKGVLWPLTAAQVRSSRKMQTIQEPMKELRERYKDNQQKMQQETMKLFKEAGVNPMAGCMPILIQMPIFFGLYFMLQSASELRFAEFLWINDLSVAENVPGWPQLPSWMWIMAGPIHILPFLNAITMHFQMQMMPTPSAGGNNMQMKIHKFLPIFVFFITYSFPSGLVLYWTVSNLLTIFQNKVTRAKIGELPEYKPAEEKASGNGKQRPTRKKSSGGGQKKKRKK